MTCEIYEGLTSTCLLGGSPEEVCRFEYGCPKTCDACRWGKVLRAVAENMKVEDSPEDLEQSSILAKLEARKNIISSQNP